MKRWLLTAGLLCLLVTAGGCYHREVTPEGLRVSFERWVPILVALGGVIVIPLGFLVFKQKAIAGIALILGGPIAAAVVAPGLFLDHVVVNDEGFYSRRGFWWSPGESKVRFDDLLMVKVEVEETRRRGGKSISMFFNCTLKNGSRERMPVGDLMQEVLPDIMEHFHKKNIAVSMPPNMPE